MEHNRRRPEKPSNGVRSRSGCLTCRRRHKKCDEQKPVCAVCHKSNRKCEYGGDLRWAAVNQPKAPAPRRPTLPPDNGQGPFHQEEPSFLQEDVGQQDSLVTGPGPNVDCPAPPAPPESLAINDSSVADLPFDSAFDSWIPSLMDLGSWDFAASNELVVPTEAVSLAGAPPGSLSLLPDQASGVAGSVMGDGNASDYGVASEAVESPQDGEGWELTHGFGSFLSMALSSPSEEIAYTYYIHHESGRIPAHDSPQNPYRRICAISLSYPLLLHTILYISTAQFLLKNALSFLEQEKNKVHGSLRGIVAPQENFSVLSLKEVTLASFLLQIVTEVMLGSENAESHLNRAYQLIRDLDYVERLPESYYARFLVQRFAIIDVLLSFLRRRKPIAPPEFALYQPCDGIDSSEPSFRELTGCPQRVLTFLAQTSYLADDLATGARETSQILDEASEMEANLRQWWQRYSVLMPSRNIDERRPGSAPDSHHHNLDTLSQCWYWTSCLLLARRVFRDATASHRVQYLRRKLFAAIDRLPAGCGPDSSLPFPFYMAAREALTPEDRDWVRRKHAEMTEMYRDRARDMMMKLTEEIWSQCDELELLPGASSQPGLGENTSLLGSDHYIHVLDSRASHFVF
ncbi:unnamed protein product [Clonostachys chloroleuca]|uniref:Zn(2)-C6 fungal-type domain-containing protein n=1 Tax=Clonostachys chloroleuca TaxID=1926264 RepID=A0AA35PXM9_9HYPO|nr:unnamed protein product [Clonostachys chloroleuca]